MKHILNEYVQLVYNFRNVILQAYTIIFQDRTIFLLVVLLLFFSKLVGSTWLSKKDIEDQLLETLIDIEVNNNNINNINNNAKISE